MQEEETKSGDVGHDSSTLIMILGGHCSAQYYWQKIGVSPGWQGLVRGYKCEPMFGVESGLASIK